MARKWLSTFGLITITHVSSIIVGTGVGMSVTNVGYGLLFEIAIFREGASRGKIVLIQNNNKLTLARALP